MTDRRPLLVALSLSSACLSIDVIPQEKDAPSPGDGDGDIHYPGDGDGDDAPPPPPECKERGTYKLGGVEYLGLKQACDNDLVCVDGACVAPPACVPGQPLTRCTFTPPDIHGVVTGFVVVGHYVYWLERGTLDARANPNKDGVIARTKFGEWSREVVLEGLEFFSESERQWYTRPLSLAGTTLWWVQQVGSRESYVHYLAHFQTSPVHQRLPVCYDWEFSQDAAFCGISSGLHKHPTDGTPLPAVLDAEVLSGQKTALYGVLDDYVYAEQGGRFVRISVSPPHLVEQLDSPPPERATATHVFRRLSDNWWASAPRDASATSWDWKAVAGPVAHGGEATLATDDTYIYWGRTTSTSRESSRQFAARSRLDGRGQQEVLVEFGEYPSNGLAYALSPLGAVWSEGGSTTTLEFAPFPPAPNVPAAD